MTVEEETFCLTETSLPSSARDCDGSSGLEGLLVIDVPNVELGAGEDIIGTENGLVDLYLGRLVLLLYGSGHEIGLVVLIGKGELDRGRIEHMALRSLGLDEGIGCGTGTEIKFLVVAVPSSPVITWSTTCPFDARTVPSGRRHSPARRHRTLHL